MITRHTNELLARLERAHDIGCAEIRKAELLRWYERERVTKIVWRDIYEKWREITEESELLIGDSDGVWVIVYGKGVTTTKGSFLRDLREWAEVEIA